MDSIFANQIIVRVALMDGHILKITVSRKDSIAKVKEIILETTGIPFRHQNLFYGDHALLDESLVEEHVRENASILEVSMVVSNPFDGVFDELVESGFTFKVEANSASEVSDKLAILTNRTGVALPAHVSDWFAFLMGKGVALEMLTPNHCVEKAELHSPGLLYFKEDCRNCEFACAKHIWLIDLNSEDGAVTCYWMWEEDDHIWDGPAKEWQRGSEVERFPNLSAFFMARVNKKRQDEESQRKRHEEHLKLSQNSTCLVIFMYAASGKEVVAAPTFDEVADLKIGDLKPIIYEMKGYPVASQTLRFKHMKYVGLDDNKLISEYFFLKPGSYIELTVREPCP